MLCALYLRKSRADLEAEARGEGETLARHRNQLLSLAATRHLTIAEIYAEVVSGDTIAERPEMQRLLRAVERGEYDAVLCMDVDRLGRGDGSDQAIILKALKYSGTLVITPYKTYDPRREMDEEFFEYSQFMARGEYKRIKRRMWAGRVASAREGKWPSSKAPFGYRRIRLERQKGWTLTPEPAEAEAVQRIFAWYAAGEEGKTRIARRVNALGFQTRSGAAFTAGSIDGILKNPVYIGKVRWCCRQKRVELHLGREIVTRPRSENCILADGLHPSIVSLEVWNSVQARLASHGDPHAKWSSPVRNPLSGLMICGLCGKTMLLSPGPARRPDDAYYKCPTSGCPTARIHVRHVNDALLFALRSGASYALPDGMPIDPAPAPPFAAASAQLSRLKSQRLRLQELLESGVYSPEVYLERSALLELRIRAAEEECARLQRESAAPEFVPKPAHPLDCWNVATPEEQNRLLRLLVQKIVYFKTRRCTRGENPAEHLSLKIYPWVR